MRNDAERIIRLLGHGHTAADIADIFGLDVADIHATLADPDHSPPIAFSSSGGGGGSSSALATIWQDGFVIPTDTRNDPLPLGDPFELQADHLYTADLYVDMAAPEGGLPQTNWAFPLVITPTPSPPGIGGGLFPANTPTDIDNVFWFGGYDGTASNFGGGAATLARSDGQGQFYALSYDNADPTQPGNEFVTFDVLRIYVRDVT
jgi:hypothetical protein